MSQINVDTIKKADGTGSLTVPAESGTVVTTASPSLGRRNLIINGAMQVAQRGTSIADTGTVGYLVCDRWRINGNVDELATYSQSTDAPDGFAYSYKYEVTTVDSTFDTNEYSRFEQRIEGQNLQHLKYGTSSAQDLTLSFWVKSSIAGNYSAGLLQLDASAGNTVISRTYTINSADTWEYKTLTYTGQTVDAIANDNTEGLRLMIYTNAGSDYTSGTENTWGDVGAVGHSVNLAETLNATFQITGVQLEVGSVATPFEHRSYGEELALCQRYYFRLVGEANKVYAVGHNYGNSVRTLVYPPTTFRALPTIEYVGPTTFYRKNGSATNNINTTGNPWTIQNSTKDLLSLYATISDTEDGASGNLYISGTGCHLSFSAEL